MMCIVLFDDPVIRTALLPFTFTRPVADIRIGILTIAEKWQKWLEAEVFYRVEEYLADKYPESSEENTLFINGAVCPNTSLVGAINSLSKGQVLKCGKTVLAGRTSGSAFAKLNSLTTVAYDQQITMLRNSWDIFKYNTAEIKMDFELITKGRVSQKITDPHTVVYGIKNLFVEEGASIRAAIINAEDGPIYIGRNAQIHEGAILKGAFALCEGAYVHIGAKMRGGTTVGPYSKVGGEVSNSVIFGYTNKAHDGFLGNSVIGEWCNMGANTNTSNLKNNYGEVKVWDYDKGGFKNTQEMFCGLMMGDYTKCAINTMFNTGTVVGVSANIFGPGFPKKFVPSFSWGGATGFTTFQKRKVFEVVEKVVKRRGIVFEEKEKLILEYVFKITAPYRVWEKKDN